MSVESKSSSEPVNRPDIDDVRDQLSALEETVDDQELAALLDALGTFLSEFKRLDAQRRQLDHRVDRLETAFPQHTKGAQSNANGWDPRDDRVIRIIDSSDSDLITLDQLKDLYRRHTDVRNPRTLKDRIKLLTSDPQFEQQSPGVWRYCPDAE